MWMTPSRQMALAAIGGRVGRRSRRERHGDERVARRGVVGERRATEWHVGAHDLGNTTLEPGAARRGLEIAPAGRGADTADRVVDRAPTGAAAEMRGQRSI